MIRFSTRIVAIAFAVSAASASAQGVPQGPKNVPEFAPAFQNQTRAPALPAGPALDVEVMAKGLERPWGIAALPNGQGYLVTERSGTLRVIGPQGNLRREPVTGTPRVQVKGQGGMLDVAIADDFAQSRRIFLTYAKPKGNGRSVTALATGVLSRDMKSLSDVRDVYQQHPPTQQPGHYGSRIVVDGTMGYLTLGDRQNQRNRVRAQDLTSTYGKVVRIRLDGAVPANNPFVGQGDARPEIYSIGHRNPQGAALHPRTGDLWVLEHGPKGGDELNRVEAGANYGWPIVSYGENYRGTPVGSGEPRATGFTEPRYYWDPVIAPGGFAFYTGRLFPWSGDVIAASLKPGGIVRLKLRGDTVVGEARYLPDLGRVRDIEIDADGSIIALTDKNNGQVVRITPR